MKKITKSIISAIVLISTVAYLSPVYAISNKETIYSKLDSTGSNYKTIVTTKNDDKIEQTNTNKKLPLEAKITYTLDGKEIKPEDLAGKSGKVKIKIEYKNKSAKNVIVNGKTEIMYTPFVVTLGTIIDGKNNKNIKVTSGGTIVENEDKITIVGVLFPGLDKNLNLSGSLSQFEIPDSLEITMDSTNFEMKNILTYATPKVLTKEVDWSEFDNLFDKANELKNGMDQISDGANELADGTENLHDGTKTLNNGASKLHKGTKDLDKGIGTLKDGTKTLNKGAKDLSTGASQLNDGMASVDKGANNLKNGLDSLNGKTEKLAGGLKAISTAVSKLNAGASNLKTGINKLVQSLSSYAENIESLKTLIGKNEALIQTLDKTEDADIIDILEKNKKALEDELALLKSFSGNEEITELVEGAKGLSDGLSELNKSTKDLPTTSDELVAGVNKLTDGASGLANGTNQLAAGASDLSNGASALSKGTQNVSSGVNELSKGSKKLNNGTKDLAKGTEKLDDGASKLADGSKELANGIQKFNEQGISKIINIVNIDLRNLVTRGKKLEELANDYNKFASDEKREDIGFISIIDSIKDDENNKTETSN